MSVSSIPPASLPHSATPRKSVRSSASSASESGALQAEREASGRIQMAEQQVKDTQREADERIRRVQADYDKQLDTESIRLENLTETERTKGYERIRDLQRAQQAEENRIRRSGEDQTARMSEYYRTNLNNIGRNGEQQLRELQSQQNRMLEYQRLKNESDTTETRENQTQSLNLIRENFEAQHQHLKEANQRTYEQKKEEYEEAAEMYQKNFEENFQKTVAQHEQIINELNREAGKKIAEIRRDTAAKLAAYSSRQEDPFYKLLELDATLSDQGDYYVLTANIPEYEQQHLSATVKGDQLVLSGYRSNREDSSTEDGRTSGTASFQSFHESFPLEWPVENRKLSRENRGDQVIIRVPKKGPFAHRDTTPKQTPEKVRISKPQFPTNIRKAPAEEDPNGDAESSRTRQNDGSGTLS